MNRLVIVPTYQREDLLYCALEAIRVADLTASIHIFPDRGMRVSEEICQKFDAVQHLVLNHATHGNSYNMLEALKWSSKQPVDRVYVIEDDCIVDKTFFEWADAALDLGLNDFAACGWQYSPDAKVSDGPDVRMPWYLSVCAALPMSSVRQIVQHARTEYYNDMQAYCDQMFPQSPNRGGAHWEQDGLILRICQQQQKRCVWPRRPRAVHAGFVGYHQGNKKLDGTLEERVRIIKLAAANPGLLSKLMSGAPLDLSPCSVCQTTLLSADKKSRVICANCFHANYPRLPKTSNSVYYLETKEKI